MTNLHNMDLYVARRGGWMPRGKNALVAYMWDLRSSVIFVDAGG